MSETRKFGELKSFKAWGESNNQTLCWEAIPDVRTYVEQLQHERDELARAIADAARDSGIYNGEGPVSGPMLLQLAKDLGWSATMNSARVAAEGRAKVLKEDATYLADVAKRFMDALNALHEAQERHEAAEPGAEAAAAFDVVFAAEEVRSDLWATLRTAVHEFEKRRDRALDAGTNPQPFRPVDHRGFWSSRRRGFGAGWAGARSRGGARQDARRCRLPECLQRRNDQQHWPRPFARAMRILRGPRHAAAARPVRRGGAGGRMTKIFILIIVLEGWSAGVGSAIGHVEFSSLERCQAARARLPELRDSWKHIRGICVEK